MIENNLESVTNKLKGIFKLEDGWHLGEGNKINQDSILISIALLEKINQDLFRDIEAFPLIEGYVELIVYINNFNQLKIDIEDRNNIYIFKEIKEEDKLLKKTSLNYLVTDLEDILTNDI